MTKPIARNLERIRWAALKSDLQYLCWFGLSLGLVIILLATLSESVFYFPAARRSTILIGLAGAGIALIVAGLIIFLLIRLKRVKRYHDTVLARRVGQLILPKPDTLINAFQLEKSLKKSHSPPLSRVYINKVDSTLADLNLRTIFPRAGIQFWKYITLGLQTILIILILVVRTPVTAALYRWAHPAVEFPVPKPFYLISHTKDINILGGDNVEIVIQSIGATPDSIRIELLSTTLESSDSNLVKPEVSYHTVGLQSPGMYVLNLTDVFQDYIYRAIVPATHFWQSWKEVSSETYRLTVTDRPIFEEFTIRIIPPQYSGLPLSIQKGNQANVQGLPGSKIGVRFKSNHPLSDGFIQINKTSIPLLIHGNRGEGNFLLKEEGLFTVNIQDQRGITNRNPIPYHLQIIPDLAPDLKVIEPPPLVELGDNQFIPIHLSIADDFGFSNLQVSYEVRRPSFIDLEPYTAIFTINEMDPAVPTQEVYSIWDLTGLALFPEDEVHYHFELYDNDDVSGPKKSLSANFIARLPSLADLFESMTMGEEELYDELELETDELQAISDQLDQAQLDLLKSDEIDWEQQQALKKTLEATREEVQKFKEFSEALEQLAEAADKHSLFSEDMLDKFQQLQELLSELITPEMLASMERMNEALENLNSKDLLSALEDLSANLEQLEMQLDRFLNIFERIRVEQTLEEIRERLEQLIAQQTALHKELQSANETSDPSDLARMAFDEERNSSEFQNIRDVMDAAAAAMEQFSPQSSQALEELQDSKLSNNTSQELENATTDLKQRQTTAALPHSQQALSNLEQLQQQFAALQQQFQNQTVNEMAGHFQAVMRDLLTLSKSQERLHNTTADLSRNSPRLGEAANRQLMLRDQLKQTMSTLMDLARETFAVTPEIGKAIGKANAQMQEAQQNLEQRNGTSAKRQQQGAMESLNKAALAVNQAMQNMQQSGSASGFEQFLQRMQQMSAQQQGLNNQGLQLALGQMAAAAQQSMMKRLLQGQQQVRKSLQQMMNEMQQSGKQGLGDLSGIAQEMEEVIKDLQRQRYTRRTQERQERILSRMLDSQRSLTQRDYKQERKSRSASQIVYSGPGGLPSDLGQRRSLALEALNRAMKSGYPRDYQDMIRRYFNTISQEETQLEQDK